MPVRPRANELDGVLHAERVDRHRHKLTRPMLAGQLPDGAMVRRGDGFALGLGGSVLPWSWQGYAAPVVVPASTMLTTLTPPSTLAVLAAGYQPLIQTPSP